MQNGQRKESLEDERWIYPPAIFPELSGRCSAWPSTYGQSKTCRRHGTPVITAAGMNPKYLREMRSSLHLNWSSTQSTPHGLRSIGVKIIFIVKMSSIGCSLSPP